jgi:hypothetical protein
MALGRKTTTKKRNSSLAKRVRISNATKDQGGGGSRVINWKDVDGEVQFFQPTVGKNAINIIPFEIKSKNHPLVKQGQMDIGELDYCLDIWTHRNVGPSESSVICLKKTYGKACPICEEAEKLTNAGKDKEATALAARRRVFYNVEDVRKKPGVLQVFEVSHYLFEKELIDEARNDDEGEDSFTDFADSDTGSVVRFRCSKTNQGGFEFNEFKSFSFTDREDPIEDELLEKAIPFDQYLNLLNYEQIQTILFGADEDSEDDDDDDSVDDEEDEAPTRKKYSAKKSVKKNVDEDSEDEDDDDEKPVKKSTKKSPPAKKKPVDVEDEEDADDDEGDEEDQLSKKTGKKSAAGTVTKGKCPNGYVFGKDADEYEECEDCDLWSKCIGGKKA